MAENDRLTKITEKHPNSPYSKRTEQKAAAGAGEARPARTGSHWTRKQ